MKTRIALLVLCGQVIVLAGCGAKPAKSPSQNGSNSASPQGTAQTTFYGVGVVKSTNPKFPSVEIAHEDIKGLMPAMTMEFYVNDKTMLDGLKPGDRISFTMTNGAGGLKITEIRKP
jgi:Cu(I)/Ag(I) efflux system protein CusF